MAKFDFGLPIALFTIAAEQPADLAAGLPDNPGPIRRLVLQP
jgi:hypothetical protein